MPHRNGSNVRKIGPHSRPNTLAKLDGRTKEAALLRRFRADLTQHVGGAPSATQRCLIDRAAMLALHMDLFDARALASGGLSERDGRQYLAYSNSLARAMKQLGFKGAADKPPSLKDHLARKEAEKAGRAAA